MNKIHWVLQKNISEKDLKELKEAITFLDMDFEDFFHIPFDNTYPTLPEHSNVFVYAASSVTDKIKEDSFSFKGVFAHTKEINIESFHQRTPEMMWNNPIFIGEIKNTLLLDNNNDDKEYFIRPVLDDKIFSGQTMTQREIKKWVTSLIEQKTEINTDECRILLAEIDYPQEEYRLFIADGKVFAATLYRKEMSLYQKVGAPKNVISLAEQFYHSNDLPYACVIDIAVNDGKSGVIEVNGINNTGFYAVDKIEWVKGITNAILTYNNKSTLTSKM